MCVNDQALYLCLKLLKIFHFRHVPVSFEEMMNENLSLRDEINTLREKEKRAETDLRQWQREYHVASINQDILEEHNETLKLDLLKFKDDMKQMRMTSSEEMGILAAEKEKAQAAYNQAFRDNIMIRENITHLKVQLDIYRDKLKEYESCDEIDYALPMMELSDYSSEDEFQPLRRSKSEPWIDFPPMYLNPKVEMYPLSCVTMSPGSGTQSYSPISSPFRRWYGYQGHDHRYTSPLTSLQQEMQDLDQDFDNLALVNEIENMNYALLSDASHEERDDEQNYMLHILSKIIEDQYDVELNYLIHDHIVSLSDVNVDEDASSKPDIPWLLYFLESKSHSKKEEISRPELIVYGSKKIITDPQEEMEGKTSSFKVVELEGRAKAYYSKTSEPEAEAEIAEEPASGDSEGGVRRDHHKGHKRSWLLRKLKIRKVAPHV